MGARKKKRGGDEEQTKERKTEEGQEEREKPEDTNEEEPQERTGDVRKKVLKKGRSMKVRRTSSQELVNGISARQWTIICMFTLL